MHAPLARGHFTVRNFALLLIGAAMTAGLFAATLSAFGEPPGVDGLVSSSHPDPTRWYNDPYPAFHWQAAEGVAGYSWKLTRASTSVPDHLVEAGAGTPFDPPLKNSVGGGPSGVAVADFDGDGFSDVATANRGQGTISVLLGYGDGTFATKVDYAAGIDPCSIVVVDLDGDGVRDLVTSARSDNTVNVLLGNGDGTFAGSVGYSTGVAPHSVGAADLDGDGFKDLVTANQEDGTMSVLLGIGDGTFAASSDYTAGEWASGVALADLDGDDAVDAVTANLGDSTVSVFLGNGDGTFATKVDSAAGATTHGVALADLDGDGDQDVVTANDAAGTVSVLLGNGDGSLAAAVDYDAAPGTRAVALADLDGDGDVDAVTANYGDDTVSVLLGNGDGTLAEAMTMTASASPVGVALGDVDGDGKRDIAYSDYSWKDVAIMLNTIPDRVAAFGPRSDGTWYFHICTVDAEDNQGPTSTLAVNIDTVGPYTRATAKTTVRRYATAALKYKIDDPRPGSPTATVTIRIKNSKGVVVKTLRPGVKPVNTSLVAKFVCKLSVGTYRYYVYATDQARNAQVRIGSNKLVVK